MNIGAYCKETLDQIPQNWQGVVTEYKEATAGKEIGTILQDWFEILKKDYLNLEGTVSRKDYAVYYLPAFIVSLIPVIGSLAVLLPNIGFGIRRLRDLNLPIWLILLPIIPVVGVIALLLVFLRNK